MNTIMIENMIQNQGYKVRSFDSSISRRRVYIPQPHRDSEYYEPDLERDMKHKRIVHRVYISLQDQNSNEVVEFEENFTDIKAFGDCVTTLGEIFEKHDDVLYKEV